MRLITMLAILFLSGCSMFTLSNKQFPQAPPSLLTKCPELYKTEESDKVSVLLSTVTSNYMKYHECAVRVEQWQYWYNEQRKNVE